MIDKCREHFFSCFFYLTYNYMHANLNLKFTFDAKFAFVANCVQINFIVYDFKTIVTVMARSSNS